MESMSATVESTATPSLSSLVPSSDVHTAASATTPQDPHGAQQTSGSKGGSSLSLIGSANAARVRLTKDFRSLVRSSSTSATSRNDRRYGQHQRTASAQVQVGAADARGRNLLPHAPLLQHSAAVYDLDAMDKPREESRGGRSFGARLVNFLSRSRSRSRSKKRRSRSMDDVAVPVSEMPTKPLQASSLGRRNPFAALVDTTNTSNSTASSSSSKPVTRSPSRPLSGATTVTDTTMTGMLQKSSRARQKSPEAPSARPIHVQAEVLGTHLAHAAGKPKRTNIFSVSISSPRKHSSRDSGISARATSPTPPEQSSRRPWSPPFRSGSGSSAGGPSSSRSNVGDPSRETPPPPVPPKPSAAPAPPRPVRPARPQVVAPVSRPVREDTITTLNSPPPPYQYEYVQREVDEVSLPGRCSPLCGLTSPRVTPVSEKGKEKERVSEKEKERERLSERERERERERLRAAVKVPAERSKEDLERRKGKEREKEITNPRRVGSPMVRERERVSRVAALQASAVPMEKTASGGSGHSKRSKESVAHAHAHVVKVKRTKHGSFDFERPVSGANGAMNMRTALQGLGIGSSTHNNARRPLDRSVTTKEKSAQAYQPSSSHHHSSSAHDHTTSSPHHHPTSTHHYHHSSNSPHYHSTSSPQSNSLGWSGKRPTVDISATPPPRHNRDGSHGHTNTTSTGRSHGNRTDYTPDTPHSSQSGHSSSLGRSAGARMMRGVHPAFKFEPAVPTIPGSPASNDRSGYMTRALDRSPSPTKARNEPVSSSKGRSLDLGLSLSWAPQRVKEEAVLSYNQSAGGHNSTTSRIRTRWRGGAVDEQGRLDKPSSRSASHVADAFKEALGDAAYNTFKTYVHRFDAHAIPLEGPYGLIAAASRLLDNAGTLDERGKRALLDRFIRFAQDNQ